MTNEEKIKEIIHNQMKKISDQDMFSVEECMQEYGEWIKEQPYTENGANDMCQCWYNKSVAERDKEIVEMIEEQKQKYIKSNEKEFGGWQDGIDTCNKIIKLIKTIQKKRSIK